MVHQLAFETSQIESRFVNGRRSSDSAPWTRSRPRRPARARDRDALLGLRQFRHALPRLPLAGRGAHRPRADRRRRARPPAHRLLPARRAAHPWDARRRLRRARARFAGAQGVRIGAINPNLFGDDVYRLGSLCHPDAVVRARRSTTASSASRSPSEIGSTRDQPLARRRHELPGPGRPARRARPATAGLEELYAALPPGMRLLVEYKFFEPGFYSTDLPDWGTAALVCRRLGRRRRCSSTPATTRKDERRADRRAAARRGPARRLPLQQPQVRRRRPDRRLDRPVRALPDHARDRARGRRGAERSRS